MKKLLVLLALGAVLFVPVSNSFAFPVAVGQYVYVTDAGGTTSGYGDLFKRKEVS